MEQDIKQINKNVEELIYFSGAVNKRCEILTHIFYNTQKNILEIEKEIKRQRKKLIFLIMGEIFFISLVFLIIFI